MKKRDKQILLFIALIAVILAIISMVSFFFLPLQITEFDVRFNVSEKIGFDLNNSALTFGSVVPGNYYERKIIIENKYDFPIKAKIFVSKDISDFFLKTDSVMLMPRENASIPITIYIPQNSEKKEYSGKIAIKIYRVIDEVSF